MEITEVRIKLMADNDDRLRAFCSITLDGEFVVRDLKIIDGNRGPFVAMPSRKLMVKCSCCSFKNEVRARYCQNCGAPQPRLEAPSESRTRMFTDIAHPINSVCREKIQSAVLKALKEEQLRAQQPGYVCTYDDFEELQSPQRRAGA